METRRRTLEVSLIHQSLALVAKHSCVRGSEAQRVRIRRPDCEDSRRTWMTTWRWTR